MSRRSLRLSGIPAEPIELSSSSRKRSSVKEEVQDVLDQLVEDVMEAVKVEKVKEVVKKVEQPVKVEEVKPVKAEEVKVIEPVKVETPVKVIEPVKVVEQPVKEKKRVTFKEEADGHLVNTASFQLYNEQLPYSSPKVISFPTRMLNPTTKQAIRELSRPPLVLFKQESVHGEYTNFHFWIKHPQTPMRYLLVNGRMHVMDSFVETPDSVYYELRDVQAPRIAPFWVGTRKGPHPEYWFYSTILNRSVMCQLLWY